MYLPLGMESHPGTLFLVMVPIQMGEVNSVLPPQTRQPHLLQRKNVQHHGNVFSQLVMKNMSNLQTFTVKELVRPVAQSVTLFKSPVAPWWTEVRLEESLRFQSSPPLFKVGQDRGQQSRVRLH